jgi:hypothetical protein
MKVRDILTARPHGEKYALGVRVSRKRPIPSAESSPSTSMQEAASPPYHALYEAVSWQLPADFPLVDSC